MSIVLAYITDSGLNSCCKKWNDYYLSSTRAFVTKKGLLNPSPT